MRAEPGDKTLRSYTDVDCGAAGAFYNVGLDRNTMADVIESKLIADALHADTEVDEWLEALMGRPSLRASVVPVGEVRGWRADPASGNIEHESGRFFSVTGVSVRHREGRRETQWDQPILEQPEVGILGIAAAKINGILHLCLQAKEEPGNINSIQLSPTVQATFSNYSRSHGGSLPLYVGLFTSPGPERVIYSRLQSEDGGRFLYKSNRNMVVRVEPAELAPLPENFIWLTLRQIRNLILRDNVVNYCARSVLAAFV